jgi:hypothetical protein
MNKKKACLIILLIVYTVILYSETPLTRHLIWGSQAPAKKRDENLTLREKLDKWFPKHQKLQLGNSYYLTTHYYKDLRADFYVKNPGNMRRATVVPDTTFTFTENSLILKTNEVIPAVNLLPTDFREIGPQVAWLNVLFRTLGTPVPDYIMGGSDEIETWIIIYENEQKERVILPSFTETMRKLNKFYDGATAYFNFSEIRKSNGRLEFFGSFFMRNLKTQKTDFIDVRFHTNRANEINLVMFFIYRDVS